MSNPGAMVTPWSTSPGVGAMLATFYPGQEMGNGVADILFGDVNPSGKLPLTFPNVENEMNMTQEQWPGVMDDPPGTMTHSVYSEGLEIGYRYYDAHSIPFTTGFPFGHGLSYTTFAYSELSTSTSEVSFVLENTGKIKGAEVTSYSNSNPN